MMTTSWQKAVFLYRLWRAWRRAPQLRLGQLLVNSAPLHRPMFYRRDEELVRRCERFAAGE